MPPLEQPLTDPFLQLIRPNRRSRAVWGIFVQQLLDHSKNRFEDLVHRHRTNARSVAAAVTRSSRETVVQQLIVSGGGARNAALDAATAVRPSRH